MEFESIFFLTTALACNMTVVGANKEKFSPPMECRGKKGYLKSLLTSHLSSVWKEEMCHSQSSSLRSWKQV